MCCKLYYETSSNNSAIYTDGYNYVNIDFSKTEFKDFKKIEIILINRPTNRFGTLSDEYKARLDLMAILPPDKLEELVSNIERQS